MLIETIFSAIFNILSVYIGFRIIRLFCPKKEESRIPPIIIYFLVWFVNWGIYYLCNNPFLTMGSLMIGLFIATLLLYKGSIVRKLVAVISEIALGTISENIVWIFLEGQNSFYVNEALGSLFSSFLLMLLVLILEKFFRLDNREHISLWSYFNIIIVMAGSTIIGEILVRLGGDDQQLATLGLSVICLIDVSTYYLYDKINEVYVQKIERKTNKQRILFYENQFNLMKQSQKNIMSLRHDMINHLILLKAYLDNQEYDDAKNYLEDITHYVDVPGQHIHTANQEIDAILNYMLERAEKMSCRIETQLEVPDSPFMSQIDLNILLGNLLDNALEALERAENPYLYINMKYHKGVFIIKIHNSFDGTLIQKGKKYITRKQDKETHGIGLQNVNDIIDKYDGEQKIETDDSLFKIEIMLYTEAVQN